MNKRDWLSFGFTLLVGILMFVGVPLWSHYSSIDYRWRNATKTLVAEHNARHPLHKIELEQMSPELLQKITNPCTVWDWRERGKCFKLAEWEKHAELYKFRSAQIMNEWEHEQQIPEQNLDLN